MKQKTDITQPTTKKDLAQLEERLGKNLKSETQALETRIDIKNDRRDLRLEDKFRQYRDDVLTKMDQVMGQLETIRDEQVLANHHAEEMLQKINNHEGRITRLEKFNPAQ
jgi:hypothetical protein